MHSSQVAKQIADLQDKRQDRHVRQLAAVVLGDLGDASAVPALLSAVGDRDEAVRKCAVDALGRIGDASAIPALIGALQDMDRGVRCNAANALGRIGDPSAVSALAGGLEDEDQYVCKCAAEALGQIGAPAIPALIAALQGEKRFICHTAAVVLQECGDSDTLPRKILADARCSAQERIEILKRLRRVRYTDSYIKLNYTFPQTVPLCWMALQEEDAAAAQGAQSVLNWLNGGNYLLRGSQPDPARHARELVRPAPGDDPETRPKTLLRAADPPKSGAQSPPPRLTFWQRLFGKR
jgi:HEAT repeat protein